MKPGRELDALIAEKVMGWKWDENTAWSSSGSRSSRISRPDDPWWWLPRYSADIAAAWEVVNKLSDKYFLVQTRTFTKQPWQSQCLILKEAGVRMKWIVQTGDTIPHAICLAALKAVGVDVN